MVSFRFTPSCCCKYIEPKNYKKPCIPNCTLIYDGLLNTDVTPVADLVASIRAARLCRGDSWWRGFYFTADIIGNSGTVHAISDVTTDYGAANSLIYIAGYSAGVRDGVDEASYGQALATNISSKLKSTNNNNGINSYFVFDNVDNKWHYDPNITEPAWLTVWSVPWNYDRFDFEFEVADDTEASWLLAPSVRIVVPSNVPNPYLAPSECGFYQLTVSDDFPDNATRWEQFHTGTYAENKYSIDASGMDSWVSSLTGQHHYGSDYFWIDTVEFVAQYENHVYSENESIYTSTQYSPFGCETSTQWYRGRFYRDEPNFTPMLPTNRYTISRQVQKYDEDEDNHFIRYYTMGSKDSIPTEWGGKNNDGFIGVYYPESRGYSYGSAMMGYTTFASDFPLGLWKYSDKPTTLDNVSNVTRRTQPCPLRKGTLIKNSNSFVYEDFGFPIIGRQGYDSLTFGMPHFDATTHTPGKCIGFYPAYLCFTKTNTTPSALPHGDVVYGCRSAYMYNLRQNRYGFGYYVDNTTGDANSDSTALGWVADREPSNGGEMLDVSTAQFNNIDLHDNNTYLKSFEVGWRQISHTYTNYAGITKTDVYWIPSIPQAIISELTSNLWVWTGTSSLTDKTWYYVPTIYITGYLYR